MKRSVAGNNRITAQYSSRVANPPSGVSSYKGEVHSATTGVAIYNHLACPTQGTAYLVYFTDFFFFFTWIHWLCHQYGEKRTVSVPSFQLTGHIVDAAAFIQNSRSILGTDHQSCLLAMIAMMAHGRGHIIWGCEP